MKNYTVAYEWGNEFRVKAIKAKSADDALNIFHQMMAEIRNEIKVVNITLD